MIAVFRWPLWLIRCCITASRLASGSTRFTKSLAVMYPRRHGFESLTNQRRSVVETGFAGELGIMQQVGVELDFGSAGAAAEEVDHAAAPQQANGELPDFGKTDCFNHHVRAASAGHGAHRTQNVGAVEILHGFIGAHFTRPGRVAAGGGRWRSRAHCKPPSRRARTSYRWDPGR